MDQRADFLRTVRAKVEAGRIPAEFEKKTKSLLIDGIKNDSDSDDAMRLKFFINTELEHTQFQNQILLELSRYLDNLIDQFDHDQLLDDQKFYFDIRHNLDDIAKLLKELTENTKKYLPPEK
jgi:hypothetical protein